MKKTIVAMLILVVLSVVIGAQVSNAHPYEVDRPGLHYKGWRLPDAAIDPRSDYTNGFLPAYSKWLSGGAKVDAMPPEMAKQRGFIRNDQGYTKRIVITIYKLPGGVLASELMTNLGMRNLPGYQEITVFVPAHSYIEISLSPGEYDVREYNTRKRDDRDLEVVSSLHVDVVPGIVILQVPYNLKTKSRDENVKVKASQGTYNFCYPQY